MYILSFAGGGGNLFLASFVYLNDNYWPLPIYKTFNLMTISCRNLCFPFIPKSSLFISILEWIYFIMLLVGKCPVRLKWNGSWEKKCGKGKCDCSLLLVRLRTEIGTVWVTVADAVQDCWCCHLTGPWDKPGRVVLTRERWFDLYC